ncbi:MAG: sulfate ABC transporter permease subunit CysW [Polyangia bacterium]
MSTRTLSDAVREPRWARVLLTFTALGFLGLFVGAPLVTIFAAALSRGAGPYLAAIGSADTWAAIKLTLLVAAITVPVNTVFGVAAAWLLARYDFVGRRLLLTLIDLPFSVSPVVAGLLFVLVCGAHGLFGPWLSAHHVQLLFAIPGVVLATAFVTFSLVAREVLTVMLAQGSREEEAAFTLGASGFQMLWHVTLPKIRWALVYGVLLCNARAMGEFGAVSVVSGHIRGRTETLPLHVEILYNEYNFVGAFAAASLLAFLALVTLAARRVLEGTDE